MQKSIFYNAASTLDDVFFTKTEQGLLNLAKPNPKPTLRKINVKLKTNKIPLSLALQRASSLLLHTETIKELQTARQYKVEYFDKTSCFCKTNTKMTKLTFVFE